MNRRIDYLDEELHELAVKEIRGKANHRWIPFCMLGIWLALTLSGYRWFPDYQSIANAFVALVLTLFALAFVNLWRYRPIPKEVIEEKAEKMKADFLKKKLVELEDEIASNKELINDVQEDLDDLSFDHEYIKGMIAE